MEALSDEDENGVPKLLTNEDADELAAAMLTTAVAGEEFLAAAEFNGQENEPVPQMVEQFQAVLSKDFSAVKKYDQPSGDGGGEREPAGQPAAAQTGKPPRGCEERAEQRSDPEFLKYSARKDRSAAQQNGLFFSSDTPVIARPGLSGGSVSSYPKSWPGSFSFFFGGKLLSNTSTSASST